MSARMEVRDGELGVWLAGIAIPTAAYALDRAYRAVLRPLDGRAGALDLVLDQVIGELARAARIVDLSAGGHEPHVADVAGAPCVSTTEAGLAFGRSARTVCRWVEAGKIRGVRSPRGDLLIPIDQLTKE